MGRGCLCTVVQLVGVERKMEGGIKVRATQTLGGVTRLQILQSCKKQLKQPKPMAFLF